MFQNKQKISQEQIDFSKYEESKNENKDEESKRRHRKNQAIWIKNINSLEIIQRYGTSDRNDNSHLIKYPKHDGASNNIVSL